MSVLDVNYPGDQEAVAEKLLATAEQILELACNMAVELEDKDTPLDERIKLAFGWCAQIRDAVCR